MTFEVRRDIKIQAAESGPGVYTLTTEGLHRQGRPELEITGMPEIAARVVAATGRCVAALDADCALPRLPEERPVPRRRGRLRVALTRRSTTERRVVAMIVVDTPQDMKTWVGKELGVSDWVSVDQERIDKFAEATGDFQWIHVDVERAKRELPTKGTIAHGYLILSMMTAMRTCDIRNRSRGINYGLNKVRFTNMVPAGARVRLRQKCLAAEDVAGGGVRVTCESIVEIEGQEKPACVAETVGISYP
jgi:acyl dehydratase